MSIRSGLILAGAALVLLLGFGIARWFYGNQVIDAQREKNNLLAQADTLRVVAGGWEKRAYTAESEKELLASVNSDLRDHLDKTDRRLRSVTSAVLELKDSRDVDTRAVARGDSTTIPWGYEDESVTLRMALAFPGMIRPDPTPPVTGSVQVAVRVRPQVAISCDRTGAPYANIEAGDERVTVLDLVTQVDEGVACLDRRRPSFGSLLPSPTVGTGIAVGAGVVAGFVLAR